MNASPANKFRSMVKAKRPEALELFTDRVDQQVLLRRILSSQSTGELENGWKNLLTMFYGVGGEGKTTLRKQTRKIAGEEFPDCTCVVTDFDGEGWTPETVATRVFSELCHSLVAQKINPELTLMLLALDRHSGEKKPGLGKQGGFMFAALEKGAGFSPIPLLDTAVKGVKWMAEKASEQAIWERLAKYNLCPEEHEGKINLLDLQAKLPLALFYDVRDWRDRNPERQLVWLIDGFERIQSRHANDDAQSRLRQFVGEFAAQKEGRFRIVIFGREKLNWAERYQEPWEEISTEHCLSGLAETDAREFLGKARFWLQSHGQPELAQAIARQTDRILDASNEKNDGSRQFSPFYLDLSLDIVERALAMGKEPDLGSSPVELQKRFFRYLNPHELRALKILALAEVFDETLFNWLVSNQLVAGFTVHGFDTELRMGRSYFLPVETKPGQWKFHKLMEEALHASSLGTEDERNLGRRMVRELLVYFGDGLKQKPERDWTDADAEAWRRGMEIIVTQGPELGLLETKEWQELRESHPWSVEHFRCLESRLDFSRRILKKLEQGLGADHPDTLSSVNSLAVLLGQKGDYAGAEPLYRRAVTGREKALGTDHQDTLSSVNNLALLLHDKGDYVGAEPLLRRALAGRETVLGPDHPDTLTIVNNLAGLFFDRGDHAGAEPLYRRALAGREKALGPDHPDTLTIVNNLAGLLSDKGDHAGAEPLSRRALAGRETVLGPDHPDTLTSVNNLALLLHDKGDYVGAEPLLRRALAGREKALGPDHPDTLTSVNNLAGLLSDKGDHAGAEPLSRRALAGRERVLGPDHPDTLTSLNNLALLLSDKGDHADAEPLCRRALAGREKVLGPDHPDTLTSVTTLAILLHLKRDHAGAEPLYRRALAGREKVLGPDHPDTLLCADVLAELLGDIGNYAGAEPLYRRALAGGEKVFGPNHPDTLTSINNLALLLKSAGRLAEAVELLQQRSAQSLVALEEVRYNLACLECLNGNLSEAERLIADEMAMHPENKEAALADEDLKLIWGYIESL